VFYCPRPRSHSGAALRVAQSASRHRQRASRPSEVVGRTEDCHMRAVPMLAAYSCVLLAGSPTSVVGLAGARQRAGMTSPVCLIIRTSDSATTLEKHWGETVRVKGTGTQTITDQQGRYALVAPPNAVLAYSIIGYRGAERPVGGQGTIDIAMEQAPTMLQEVVVTGYQTQRRSDITGAVSSVNLQSANRQTSTSVLQRLDGRIPGVTVNNSGSPGSRSTVRIRGVSSFHDNDPLYIIDGTPVDDSYLNFLNPKD